MYNNITPVDGNFLEFLDHINKFKRIYEPDKNEKNVQHIISYLAIKQKMLHVFNNREL